MTTRFSIRLLVLMPLLLAGRALAQSDWGDAPNTYRTTNAVAGPFHLISPSLRIGPGVDAEADGQPGPATGDDLNGADDEDGVAVYESATERAYAGQIGSWSRLMVDVHRLPLLANAWLNAWCDFNSDGDFLDAGERIVENADAVNGVNLFGFFTPETAAPGPSVLRVRLGDLQLPAGVGAAGGFGGIGEVEDHRIDFVARSPATNVQAHESNGQVWITWQFNPAAAAQGYEVYTANAAIVNVNQGTLVARLFPEDYAGLRLVQDMSLVYGAGGNANFTIPDGAGGTVTLAANRGLCVETVRPGGLGARFYAVVPAGVTAIPAASLSALIPQAFYSALPVNLPACHLQQSGIVNGYRHSFFALWGDGDDTAGAGRPDFPLMANAARRGVPHHFLVVTPDPLPAGARPMTLSMSAGNSEVTSFRPGADGWRAQGGDSPEGISVSLEERVVQIFDGRPESHQCRWMGWVPSWDPFANRPPLPANNAKVQPYCLNRLNWMLAWLKQRSPFSVDAHSVALRGYSAGSVGAMLWAHTSPQHFSHLTMFCPPLHWEHAWPDREPLYGTDAQNLEIDGLTSASGDALRAREIRLLVETLGAGKEPLPTKLFAGKREHWWAIDYEADFIPDMMQDWLAADAFSGALGVQFWWDQRQHGTEDWKLDGTGPLPPGCPAWTAADFWIPTFADQTRRDDVFAHHRFRNDRSFPAFHRMQVRRAMHGDPGTVDYGTPPVPFQQLADRSDPPYTGPNTDPCTPWLPEITGDRRGTWGGYFDWFTPANTADPDAQVDAPGQWATSVALVKDTDAGGMVVPDIDDAPMEFLIADVAVRRAQNFLPPTGTQVTWMNVDRDTDRVAQSGIETVGARALVRMPDVIVPRLPRKARLIAATQMDFGDAPAAYPVTLAQNGARHATDSVLRLGADRTLETDGTHHAAASLAAEGDNGVTAPVQWQAGTVVVLTINVSAACRLDAWVDWARNGQWAGGVLDTADQIAAALPLGAGANTLAIAVPNAAVAGATFARFRVSTGGCLMPAGPAPDGEVEDYPLLLTAAPQGDNPAISVTNVSGVTRLNWTGNSAWSYVLEHSADLVAWLPALHPAGEITGAMSIAIPAGLMGDPRRFFRIRRSPLVTSSIACAPGPQLGQSFVHTNGSLLTNESGQRVTTSIARNYHLYVPDTWNPSRTWPLVLMLHGTSMTGAALASTQSELRALANQRGYITVFPDSTGNAELVRWFTNPDPASIQPGNPQPFVDDKAFLFSLMNHLVNSTGLRVDGTRLYCGGFSNGAAMVHWLASDINHPFRAFAIMDGLAPLLSMYEPRVGFDLYGSFGGTFPDFPVAKPRPCLIMNLVTSGAVSYEGQPLEDDNGAPVDIDNDGDFDRVPSARDAVGRWLTANSLPALPATTTRHAFINDPAYTTPATANLALLPSSENHFFRPDAWWPVPRKALYAAAYADFPNAEIPNSLRTPAQELAVSWFQTPANWQPLTSYPHITFTQNRRTFTVAGTWSEEIWPSPPGQSDREVRFYTLSDGGHQWPGAADKVGWDAQLGVIDFFDAH